MSPRPPNWLRLSTSNSARAETRPQTNTDVGAVPEVSRALRAGRCGGGRGSRRCVHADIGCALLEARDRCTGGKADRGGSAIRERLIDTAEANGRILQVGHLERFNPAVQAVQQKVTLPLFFEIHRMSMFSPRSLDVDVVLDLMIHDIDVVLALTGLNRRRFGPPAFVFCQTKWISRTFGLAFPGGCVANLTASRVSTEKDP